MLKDKIVRWVIKSDRRYYVWRCLRGFTDKEFVNNVNHMYDNIYSVHTVKRGEKHKGKVLYHLYNNEYIGFCGILIRICRYLAYADSMGMYPIISLGKDFPYYEKDGVDGITNPWEYYFKQYGELSLEDLKCGYRVAEFQEKEIWKFSTEWKIVSPYTMPEEAQDIIAEIVKKYIILNEKTNSYILNSIDKVLNNKKTLGVQIRMGSMLIEPDEHPKVPSINEYIDKIHNVFEKSGYEQIFLATDDIRALEAIKQEFGDKVVYYDDVARVADTTDVFELNIDRKHHKYLSGLEVLRDFYTLATCSGMVAGMSNVSMCARIWKKSRNEKFEDLYILDNGLHHNGISVVEAKNLAKEKKGENER